MEKFNLEVTQGVYKTAKDARNADRIPMVYYGKGVEPINFSADYQDFRRLYKKAGKSTVISLKNEEGKEFNVLVHEMQYDPVSDNIIHVDLMAVDMNKPITTEIPLEFVGTSPAVRDENGIFVTSKYSVAVECLPKDLVHSIEVDISPLIDFHTAITVGDIKAPNGITIIDAEDINVATVSAPRLEEEPVEAAEEAEKPAEEGGEEGEKKEEGSEEEGEK
ncbi:50S ribosomal protein L25 [Candidatus Peregrinibacteria bacterium]|nr:50S ribosomal protein L25 [Candidatus Peregrinibacteria bacterium]